MAMTAPAPVSEAWPGAGIRPMAGCRVAVLCGGPGVEREVSLESGRQVYEALAADSPDVTLRDVRTARELEIFLDESRCNVAVLMLHGELGEDGEAPRRLEKRGVAYTGSAPDACVRSFDKNAAKQRLAAAGLPVAPWGIWRAGSRAADAWRAAGAAWPVVVKPNASGSSVGVAKVGDEAALEEALARAAACGNGEVMIEAHVAGREFTASVLDGKPLPLVEIHTRGRLFDYGLKYGPDGHRCVCPAEVDPPDAAAWRAMAVSAAEALGARDLCRIDFMVGESGPRLLEINTAPGFTRHSLAPMAARAAGIPFRDLCWMLVGMALRRQAAASVGHPPPARGKEPFSP